MTDHARWPDAALAGLACSMRTFAGPAVLAVRGRISGKPRYGVLAAGVGELATDKTPAATDRTDVPALTGRIAAGAYAGNEIAGPAGIAAGAIAAGLGSFSTWRIRKLVVSATGLPDPVVAIGEDLIAFGAAALATQGVSDERGGTEAAGAEAASDDGEAGQPPARSPLRDAAAGLFASVVGTAVMTLVQGAEFVLTPAEPSSSPAEVAEKISKRAGLGRIKRRHKPAVNQGMHWLYGTSWGIPYGLVATGSNTPPEISGPVFGLLVWSAALAQQPALGIAEVPWKRSPSSLGSEALFHLVYGIGAGGGLRVARRALAARS